MASMMTGSYERLPDDLLRRRTELSLAATILALRRYHADHDHHLPDLLEHLVPQYLPAVPVDVFSPDLSPLRYDPARGLIWTVGTNAVDDGGDITPPPVPGWSNQTPVPWNAKDFGFPVLPAPLNAAPPPEPNDVP